MRVALLSGSVYGAAEDVAHHAVRQLQALGHHCYFDPRGSLAAMLAYAPEALLGITSTTGMGEIPDNLVPLYSELSDTLPLALRGLPGGVIGLGDSSYSDTFCAGGEQLQALFEELGVRQIQPMLRLDASESVTPETDAEPWLEAFGHTLLRNAQA